MNPRTLIALLLTSVGFDAVQAADIEGTITIKRTLTKRKVTAPVSAYRRGVTVELGSNPDDDPLDFERARVVIYLDGNLPTKPAASVIEQKHRRFLPDTVVVPVGSTISFPNLDPIFHNVFSLSKPKSFDLGNYPKDQTRVVAFDKPGIVFVHCHLHPNMSAAILVSPNRWSVKADASGRFVLAGVPPGQHTVVAWHRAAGFFRETVRVTENNGAAVRFIIPLEAEGVSQTEARR